MDNRSDTMRQLLELGLNYSRKHKSTQTGYLHYCYNINSDAIHLPIPTIENFFLALNLLRSRTIENINEAKIILEGLLHFQNTSDEVLGKGNFPIYLHDYPNCKDRFIGVQISIIIYWTLKLFHQILGQKLKASLESALRLLLKHILKTHSEKPAQYPTAIKIAAVAKVAGQLLHDETIASAGDTLLTQLESSQNSFYWYSPEALGEILTGLTIVYHKLSDSPWSALWRHLENTWHRKSCCYIGHGFKEWQMGEEPQVTLYDLFMSYYSGTISARILKENFVHLEVVLISPSEDTFMEPQYPLALSGKFEDTSWYVYHNELFAYSVIEEKHLNIPQLIKKGFYPLKFVWGDREMTNTFVCQGGNGILETISQNSEKLMLSFKIEGAVDVEDRENAREIVFCINNSNHCDFFVEGEKSSTFQLGEKVSLGAQLQMLELSFELIEGSGKFIGHRMLGNRPAQLNLKGNHRYDAFDWLVFLRTLSRSETCRINVVISPRDCRF